MQTFFLTVVVTAIRPYLAGDALEDAYEMQKLNEWNSMSNTNDTAFGGQEFEEEQKTGERVSEIACQLRHARLQ